MTAWLISMSAAVAFSSRAACAEAETEGVAGMAAVTRVAVNRALRNGTTVQAEWCRPGQFVAARPLCRGRWHAWTKARNRCPEAHTSRLRAVLASALGWLGVGVVSGVRRDATSFDHAASLARVTSTGETVAERWARRGLVEVARVGRLVFFARRGEVVW